MSIESAKPKRKSVVFVICDDLAWADLAIHGNPIVHTVHLDALGHESVEMTRCLSGPLCTAARASLMTGRHAYRTRAIDTYLGRSMMDPGEITLAQCFAAAGHRTSISGKWHLGDCYPLRAMDRGFQEALVHNGGGLRQPGNWFFDGYFDPELLHNGHVCRTQGYCTDVITNHAIEQIKAAEDRPFFAYVAFNAPHDPLEISDRWSDRYEKAGVPTPTARLYGMIENIDYNVGRLRKAINDTGRGDDTLFIFTSDHGGTGSIDGSRYSGGLRGTKSSLYEGGIRVPCFIYNAGLKPLKSDVLCNPMDWLPTLAPLCGLTVPTDRKIDGLDLMPAWRGEESQSLHDRSIIMQWHRGAWPRRGRNAVVAQDRYKWISPEHGPAELYDVRADPGETVNLASSLPDRVRDMAAAYNAWFDDVSSERQDNYAPPRIKVSPEHEPQLVLTSQDCIPEDDSRTDWGLENPGKWMLQSDRAQVATVRVETPPQFRGAILNLRVGPSERTTMITSEATEFQSVPIPKGDFDVWALVQLPTSAPMGVTRVRLFARETQ